MLIVGDAVRIGEKADANGVTMVNQHAIKMKSDVQEVAIIVLLSKVPLQIKLHTAATRYLLQDSLSLSLCTISILQRALLLMIWYLGMPTPCIYVNTIVDLLAVWGFAST